MPEVVPNLPDEILYIAINRDLFPDLVEVFKAFDIIGELKRTTARNLEMPSLYRLAGLWRYESVPNCSGRRQEIAEIPGDRIRQVEVDAAFVEHTDHLVV